MKGVIFDLDGVITDTAKFHFEAWKRLAQEKFSLDLPAEFETQLKGVSRTESLRRILKFGQITLSQEELEEYATQKNAYYLSSIEKLTSADILPGIKELLVELKEHNIKIALGSASNNAPFILEKLGLMSYFATIVDPKKVLHGKPAPDIFLVGAEQLGLSATQCVGIEDSVAGITAIKDAQMLAVGVGNAEELKQADIIVPSTKQLTYALLSKL